MLISDLSRTQHPDKWIGDTLHFAGAGTVGDQKITGLTNSKLADSRTNGVQIILFQVFQPKQFVYCGPVKMAGDPYTVTKPDKNGLDRLVWVFPIQLTHAQPIPKVGELVFAVGCLQKTMFAPSAGSRRIIKRGALLLDASGMPNGT